MNWLVICVSVNGVVSSVRCHNEETGEQIAKDLGGGQVRARVYYDSARGPLRDDWIQDGSNRGPVERS